MADTVNELWQDALLRHQIGLMRVSGSLRNRIIALLNATEDDLASQIRRVLRRLGPLASTRALRRLAELERQVREIRHAAFLNVSSEWRTEARSLARGEPDFLGSALSTVAPVAVTASIPDPALLRNIVTRRPFQGRVLRDHVAKLERDDRARIMAAIRIGMVQGEGIDAIVRRVLGTAREQGRNGATQRTRNNVAALVRTSVNHITNHAKREFYLANADIFAREVYLATLDGRTTAICRSLDHDVFPIGQGPIPPVHWNCRSVRVAVVDDNWVADRPAVPVTRRRLLRDYTQQNGLASVTRRADLPRGHKVAFDMFQRTQLRALTGQVPGRTTYQQWLSRQSVQFQNDVLGRTRGILFRRGGLTLDRFVNRRGDELTLAQLARRDRQAFVAAGLDPNDFPGP